MDYLITRQIDDANSSGDGSLDNNSYKTALATQAWFNQSQALVDTDGDGIPDSVEAELGTNPNAVDTAYLESGNGNNFNDNSGGFLFTEMIVGQSISVQLDNSSGVFSVSNGEVPAGLVLNSASGYLTGTPTTLGSYSFSYQVIRSDGSNKLGTASIRVVTPDSDTDGDGLTAAYEMQYASILSSLNGNDASVDSDGDGLTNLEEYGFGSNPTLADADGDGLNDAEEELAGTDPNSEDSDLDGIPDGYEFFNDLDVAVNDADGDLDNDGLTNYEEYLLGLYANNPDFDDDGLLDGEDFDPFVHLVVVLIPIFTLMN